VQCGQGNAARRRPPPQELLPTYCTPGKHMRSSVSSAHASCCAFGADAANLDFSRATRQRNGHSIDMRCEHICVYLCISVM